MWRCFEENESDKTFFYDININLNQYINLNSNGQFKNVTGSIMVLIIFDLLCLLGSDFEV